MRPDLRDARDRRSQHKASPGPSHASWLRTHCGSPAHGVSPETKGRKEAALLRGSPRGGRGGPEQQKQAHPQVLKELLWALPQSLPVWSGTLFRERQGEPTVLFRHESLLQKVKGGDCLVGSSGHQKPRLRILWARFQTTAMKRTPQQREL